MPLTPAVSAGLTSTPSPVSYYAARAAREASTNAHTGGWGECPLPICVGHEVVGKAIKVGKDVKTIKVGDRVGVGAQIQADLDCGNCKADQENYCTNGELKPNDKRH